MGTVSPVQLRYAKRVADRLHRAAPGTMCQCGPCHVQLLELASALGTSVNSLKAMLGASVAQPVSPQRPVRPLRAMLGASARVLVDGRKVSFVEGLTEVIRRAG